MSVYVFVCVGLDVCLCVWVCFWVVYVCVGMSVEECVCVYRFGKCVVVYFVCLFLCV